MSSKSAYVLSMVACATCCTVALADPAPATTQPTTTTTATAPTIRLLESLQRAENEKKFADRQKQLTTPEKIAAAPLPPSLTLPLPVSVLTPEQKQELAEQAAMALKRSKTKKLLAIYGKPGHEVVEILMPNGVVLPFKQGQQHAGLIVDRVDRAGVSVRSQILALPKTVAVGEEFQ